MQPIPRKFPVRVSILSASGLIVLLNMLLPAIFPGVEPLSEPVLLALLTLAGVGVGADAVRPSGMAKKPPGAEPEPGTPIVATTDDRAMLEEVVKNVLGAAAREGQRRADAQARAAAAAREAAAREAAAADEAPTPAGGVRVRTARGP